MLRHGAETGERKRSAYTISARNAQEGKIRVLLIHPGFTPNIWTLDGVLPIVGKRAFLPPLGLITVAALLPAHWELRLVDGAVRPPSGSDWAWAELVMITGMIVQRDQMLELLREAGARGRPVAMGGPFVTSVPDPFDAAGADYLVLGEGETVIPDLVAHLEAQGPRRRDGAAVRFDGTSAKPDVTRTPPPGFDLLELDAYLSMSVQYSRGCSLRRSQLHALDSALATAAVFVGFDIFEAVDHPPADLEECRSFAGPAPALKRARADLQPSCQLDLVEMRD